MMVVRSALKNTFSLAAPQALSSSMVKVVAKMMPKKTMVLNLFPPILPATMATEVNQNSHTNGLRILSTNPLPRKTNHDGLSSAFFMISSDCFSINLSRSFTFRRYVKKPNNKRMTPAPIHAKAASFCERITTCTEVRMHNVITMASLRMTPAANHAADLKPR